MFQSFHEEDSIGGAVIHGDRRTLCMHPPWWALALAIIPCEDCGNTISQCLSGYTRVGKGPHCRGSLEQPQDSAQRSQPFLESGRGASDTAARRVRQVFCGLLPHQSARNRQQRLRPAYELRPQLV